MSINVPKKQKLNLSKVSFGQHGQMSIILCLIRFYFQYKGLLSLDEEQALLKVLCFNIKHFIALSQGQKFLAYEKNTYAYYKEKSYNRANCKNMFLDIFVCQVMLTKEYESAFLKGSPEHKNLIEQIYLESKECENVIKQQIMV